MELNVTLDKTTPLHLEIAPFLLIPFVENAFKHVSHGKNSKNWIDIRLHVAEQNLHFTVSNSRNALVIANQDEANGIGLANVKRRLELLYPNAHTLEIIKDNLKHSIKLDLRLHEIETEKTQTA